MALTPRGMRTGCLVDRVPVHKSTCIALFFVAGLSDGLYSSSGLRNMHILFVVFPLYAPKAVDFAWACGRRSHRLARGAHGVRARFTHHTKAGCRIDWRQLSRPLQLRTRWRRDTGNCTEIGKHNAKCFCCTGGRRGWQGSRRLCMSRRDIETRACHRRNPPQPARGPDNRSDAQLRERYSVA
jgi:hypothetical protein